MPIQQAAVGGVFFLIWGLMMLGALCGYIILLVALWRAMKAHESIARSAGDIARTFRDGQSKV